MPRGWGQDCSALPLATNGTQEHPKSEGGMVRAILASGADLSEGQVPDSNGKKD